MATTTTTDKVYTWDEVAQHNSVSAGVWVVIDGCVYDVTQFIDEHPGGDEVLLDNAGKDASTAFKDVGHTQDAVRLREGFLIGRIASSDESPPSSDEDTSAVTSQFKKIVGVVAGAAVPLLAAVAVAGVAYLIYRRYKR